ncbi:MAG: hypothetical protein ABL872_11615 [Lacibacter sp.]
MKELLKKVTPLYRLYLSSLQWRRRIKDKLTIPEYAVKRKTIIDLSKQYQCTEVFIETGTYMGDTVEYLKHDFAKLFSIELNEDLASKAAKRFSNEPKVKIVQGDSAQQLAAILSDITTPVAFWLDGHYSSEFQLGDDYIVTGKGEKDTPVMEELMQISQHPVKKHVILIDDARLFNGQNDYPTKQQVSDFVKQKLPSHTFSIKRDIIRILPTNK